MNINKVITNTTQVIFISCCNFLSPKIMKFIVLSSREFNVQKREAKGRMEKKNSNYVVFHPSLHLICCWTSGVEDLIISLVCFFLLFFLPYFSLHIILCFPFFFIFYIFYFSTLIYISFSIVYWYLDKLLIWIFRSMFCVCMWVFLCIFADKLLNLLLCDHHLRIFLCLVVFRLWHESVRNLNYL